MKNFTNHHPCVLMVYFLSVTSIVMFVWNPIIQLIALLSGFAFSAALQTKKEVFSGLVFYLLFFLIICITNPLFSHKGVTILLYINDNPFTLEALIYGISIAIMVIGIIFWFKCYSLIMTSDKFLYLFGKIIPKISLILSMILRFVPMLKKQIKRINNSQKTMGLYSSNGYIKKFKSGSRVLSAIVSWSLENSIDTASSMKARGYGLKNRTNYSNFNFILKDKLILFFVIFFSVIIFFGAANGEMDFYYYPQISSINITPFSLLCYLSYFIIAFSPLILEFTECLKWKYCKSKI